MNTIILSVDSLSALGAPESELRGAAMATTPLHLHFDLDSPKVKALKTKYKVDLARFIPASAKAPKAERRDYRSLIWERIHERPIRCIDLAGELDWLNKLNVPCGECKAEWKRMLDAGPDLSSRLNYASWTWWKHNEVNAKIGKPVMPWATAAKLYGWDSLTIEPAKPIDSVVELATYFDRVVYINLDRRADRRQQFERHFADLPFKPERFAAFDGREMTPPKGWGHGNGAFGCLRSHQAAIAKAMADGAQSILIFEDDAKPVQDAAGKLLAFLKSVPRDWTSVFLGGQQLGEWKEVSPGVIRSYAPHRLHAYALRGQTIKAVHDAWATADHHADHAIKDLLGKLSITYMPDPPIFGQGQGPSDIGDERIERAWAVPKSAEGRRIEALGLTIISAKTGYGSLGLNGDMGFDAGCEVLPPPHLRGQHMLGAHADSRVVIHLEQPAKVTGFLNASSLFASDRPVEFWADDNWLGIGSGASDCTEGFRLEPGQHVLQAEIQCHASNPNRIHHRHSAWAIEPQEPQSTAGSAMATRYNTAIVSIAEYPIGEVHGHIRILARSIRRHGERHHVFGEGTKYISHFVAKVINLRRYVQSLPSHYTHVLYLDGLDTLLALPLTSACDAFNAAGHKILVSVEPSCWPVGHKEVAEAFPPAGVAGRWINAGEFMAERKALDDLLSDLAGLYERFGAPDATVDLAPFWPHRWHRDNDQFLWHCRFILGGHDIGLDRESSLFATATTTDLTLGPSNTHYVFTDDHNVIVKGNGNVPAVLHFSGWGHPDWHHRWASYLRMI